jgi:hypothetical protein
MLVLQMRSAVVTLKSDEEFDKVLKTLSEAYQPVLQPAVMLQAKALGLEKGPSQQSVLSTLEIPRSPRRTLPIRAEIFIDEEKNLYLLVLRLASRPSKIGNTADGSIVEIYKHPIQSRLTVYYISQAVSSIPLSQFEKIINDNLSIKLAPYFFTSDRLAELKSEGMNSPDRPTESELASARLLSDSSIRTLAMSVKSSGGLLIGDLPKQLPSPIRDQADDIRTKLLAANLISAELVVICKRTQAQVARAPSQRILKNLSKNGLKCACGRPIADERIEEAVTITDHGRSLLDSSHWFSVLLLHELLELGIPLDRILRRHVTPSDRLEAVEAHHRTGHQHEGEPPPRVPVPPHLQPPEATQPRQRPLDLPAVAPKPGRRLDLTPSDPRLDPTAPQIGTVGSAVIAGRRWCGADRHRAAAVEPGARARPTPTARPARGRQQGSS